MVRLIVKYRKKRSIFLSKSEGGPVFSNFEDNLIFVKYWRSSIFLSYFEDDHIFGLI